MSENTINTIYDRDGKRRVIIFRRDDGTYGFEEERFSDEPLEMAWIRLRKYTASLFASAIDAERDARGRVEWLGNSSPET
ncbi:hypothetical protein FRZ44_09730 [Hypericibacter terrae]|uniref:Uncharacterized protein n=1 Tax=Hypericibacter terrae TaxID=2602015 RepID=A0A5J6MLP6_9PROT|nr:hypothetical protein [Hypericibacter terrae]QEX15686.1 hypothetical protein FRZ44_09730 [Hypericibacter terrae]